MCSVPKKKRETACRQRFPSHAVHQEANPWHRSCITLPFISKIWPTSNPRTQSTVIKPPPRTSSSLGPHGPHTNALLVLILIIIIIVLIIFLSLCILKKKKVPHSNQWSFMHQPKAFQGVSGLVVTPGAVSRCYQQ